MIAPRRRRLVRRCTWAAFGVRLVNRCKVCKARGFVRSLETTAFGSVVSVTTCRACGGIGFNLDPFFGVKR